MQVLEHPQPTQSLRLEEETHTYWLGGDRIPGISELLRYWGYFDDTYYTEMGRDIGSAVHAGIHDIEVGGAAAIEFSNVKILHRLDEYVRFKGDKDFRVLYAERILLDPGQRYACKIDLWGQFGDSTTKALVEVKCGAELAWHKLQTAGQRRCLPPEPTRRFALYLPATGRYSLKEHTDRADEALVDGLASGFWWNKNHNVILNAGGTHGK